MIQIITKQDIADVTGNFTTNIEDRLINPKILNAQTFDLGVLLGSELFGEVIAMETKPDGWDSETEYNPGDLVSGTDGVYKALVITMQPITSVDWEFQPLETLRFFKLTEYLAWNAYCRFLLTHGRNITQAGLTQPQDPQGTYSPLSDKSRAELAADAESKADFYGTQIRTFLKTYNLITESCKRASKSRLRISGI